MSWGPLGGQKPPTARLPSTLDRVVSSYAPTLKALATARARPQAPSPDRLLLIALPDTPGTASLPAVAAEQAFLTSHFDGRELTVLADADATHANILRELTTHTWLHAACHGDQDMADPSSGGLLPHDWGDAGLLSILDLTTTGQAGGEFAFLSACKSAVGGVAMLDESVNLAAALHFAGWRRVIGTLWSVWDADAAQITADVYALLTRSAGLGTLSPAEALHATLVNGPIGRTWRRIDAAPGQLILVRPVDAPAARSTRSRGERRWHPGDPGHRCRLG